MIRVAGSLLLFFNATVPYLSFAVNQREGIMNFIFLKHSLTCVVHVDHLPTSIQLGKALLPILET